MSRDAEMASAGFAKSPLDWYVEPLWPTTQLLGHEFFYGGVDGWGTIWDPACGLGNILKSVEICWPPLDRHATDIVFRGYAAKGIFEELDFIGGVDFVRSAAPKGRFSIVSNPPFSYVKGISEAFVRRALELATEKVAMLLPIKWQASQARHRLFTEFPPSRIWILSERPSMPPGAMVEALGDKAFKHGKVDYMWVVWDVANPTAVTEWRTIGPRVKAKGDV